MVLATIMGRGVVTERGAAPAYALMPYGPYADELADRGIDVRFSG